MIPGLLSHIQQGIPAVRDADGVGDIVFVVFEGDTAFEVVLGQKITP